MSKKVKPEPLSEIGRRSRFSQTRISRKHQVTIPRDAFRAAGLSAGETLRVEADGAGRVVLTRVDELVDRYAGSVSSQGRLAETVRDLRREWR